MKPDDFEARLSRVPLQPPPSDWRDDILRAAHRAAAPARVESPTAAPSPGPSTAVALLGLIRTLRERLGSPAGLLSAGWVLAFALFGFNRLLDPTRPAHVGPMSADFAALPPRTATLAAARGYQAQVNALTADDDAGVMDFAPTRPAPSPTTPGRPRSELTPARTGPPSFLRADFTPAARTAATSQV